MNTQTDTLDVAAVATTVRRRPGRPKGSKNKPKKGAADIKKDEKPIPPAIKITRSGNLLKVNGFVTSANLNTDPSGNCQLALLGRYNCIRSYIKNIGDYAALMTYVRQFKRLLLLDIKVTFLQELKKWAKGDIILEAPYKSTNGSNMVLVIINVNKYVPKSLI